jgi:hypothetical protein
MSGNFDTLKGKYYQSLATDFQIFEIACDLQQIVLTKPEDPMDVDRPPTQGDVSPTDSDLVI